MKHSYAPGVAPVEIERSGPPIANLSFGEQGRVPCLHGTGIIASTVTKGGYYFGSIAIRLDAGQGLYMSISAGEARAVAAALLNVADALDGGTGKQ